MSAYRKEGAKALVHGNRGRQPANTLSQEIREKIVELAQDRYKGVNHCHPFGKLSEQSIGVRRADRTPLTELLAEREGVQVSRSTLRCVLALAGIGSSSVASPK